MNLAEETRGILRRNGKMLSDILWIGSKDFEIPQSMFWELADREYDPNTGTTSQNVAVDLVIVGRDFWLERVVKNNQKQWECKEYPKRPTRIKTVRSLIGYCYAELIDLV